MSSGTADIGDLVRELDATPLASPAALREQARATAAQVEPGRSAFMDEYGVDSELDYKRQAMRDGQIMYHAHIGLNDAAATAGALADIHRELQLQGYRLDRAGIALDRRMGLPPELRSQVAAETGPLLALDEDWESLARPTPIQPHLGDFMIGQPASVANTVRALRIGCTTIGNLSQFFTFEAPGWSDLAGTATSSCEAMLLLAEYRERGVMLHSYLEDGYGALFRNCASVAAWAMLERYIVEELIGARLSHCIGGLTRDPIKRAGWVFVLQRIHRGDHIGSMIYGDTLSFGPDFEKNRALTAEYLLWDILAQMHVPSGHALLPLPVTEAIRIPASEEIIEAQLFGRRVEQSARRFYAHIDFGAAETFADRVYRQGRQIYRNALDGLDEAGVDLRDPVRLLYLLKTPRRAAFRGAVRRAGRRTGHRHVCAGAGRDRGKSAIVRRPGIARKNSRQVFCRGLHRCARTRRGRPRATAGRGRGAGDIPRRRAGSVGFVARRRGAAGRTRCWSARTTVWRSIMRGNCANCSTAPRLRCRWSWAGYSTRKSTTANRCRSSSPCANSACCRRSICPG